MKGVVQKLGGVGNDALDVGVGWLDKVDGRNVVDWFAILVDEEVEGDAVLAEVLYVDERRQYVLAETVVDEDLVHLLVGCPTGIHRLI